jgi:hypothetical protein
VTCRLGAMTLTPGERYTITYRDGREERTALAHYRGFGTGDAIARGEETTVAGEGGGVHWFELDGVPGYITLEDDDLVSYELADPYG